MPHKLCKFCKHPNGVRAAKCKECGQSFAPKPTGAAAISSTTQKREVPKISLDNPDFYGRFMVGVSTEFNYGDDDDDLAACIAGQRGLDKSDVDAACKMTIYELWSKRWKN